MKPAKKPAQRRTIATLTIEVKTTPADEARDAAVTALLHDAFANLREALMLAYGIEAEK